MRMECKSVINKLPPVRVKYRRGGLALEGSGINSIGDKWVNICLNNEESGIHINYVKNRQKRDGNIKQFY